MNCKIIKDLLPLYIDGCCSDESSDEIENHLRECAECKAIYDAMKANLPSEENSISANPSKVRRVNYIKASLLQSSLLFVSFVLITLGVYIEASSPSGWSNNIYAFSLVVPVTGFMLSLANWHFIHLYKNKKAFSKCSCVITISLIVILGIWTGFHYDFSIFEFIKTISGCGLIDALEATLFLSVNYIVGLIITPLLCLLSELFADKYADFLGKE